MPSRGPRYSEQEARVAVAASMSYAEALRRLGMCPAGGSWLVLRKWIDRWGISTTHFDPAARRNTALGKPPKPLAEILVENSTYSRHHLKRRLFEEGLKRRECELCGHPGELFVAELVDAALSELH